jgi:hypothetical protein
MVGDITRGTSVNQSFSDVLMHVTGVQGLRDQSSPQTVVASSGQHLLAGLAEGRRRAPSSRGHRAEAIGAALLTIRVTATPPRLRGVGIGDLDPGLRGVSRAAAFHGPCAVAE